MLYLSDHVSVRHAKAPLHISRVSLVGSSLAVYRSPHAETSPKRMICLCVDYIWSYLTILCIRNNHFAHLCVTGTWKAKVFLGSCILM